MKAITGLLLFTSCVCPNPLHANGNENGEPIVNKVKLQFTSTATGPEPLFLLTADGEVVPIELPRQHLSPIIELESMKSWSVGLHDVETGEFDAVAVASALDSAHQILIFTTDPLEGGFALTAIEGSPERFKADTYQLLNASGKKI
ncbi:MAG: hypothetical protein R3242_04450, partial [Akkermansiaceae bacterium]|nr:hypothetical protein [Akkermansiaceae bacterium]